MVICDGCGMDFCELEYDTYCEDCLVSFQNQDLEDQFDELLKRRRYHFKTPLESPMGSVVMHVSSPAGILGG